jgi:hypothetical protein
MVRTWKPPLQLVGPVFWISFRADRMASAFVPAWISEAFREGRLRTNADRALFAFVDGVDGLLLF